MGGDAITDTKTDRQTVRQSDRQKDRKTRTRIRKPTRTRTRTRARTLYGPPTPNILLRKRPMVKEKKYFYRKIIFRPLLWTLPPQTFWTPSPQSLEAFTMISLKISLRIPEIRLP